MSLATIPTGSKVLIDSNILIYARSGLSEQCRQLLIRCAAREISGFISAIGLAEFCHRRMMQEAQSCGVSGSNPAKVLSRNPMLVRKLTHYPVEVEDLLAGDLHVVPLEGMDFIQALELQRAHGLMTNDSLHLAAAIRSDIHILVTADRHFSMLPDLVFFQPDDIR